MKVPDKFRVTLTGTVVDIVRRENVARGLGRPLAELLSGTRMPDNVFRPWYLDVAITEGAAAGPMSIHTLAAAGAKVEIRCAHCGRAAIYEAKPLSDLCREKYYGSDLRDLGLRLRCHANQGGCGQRGATVSPAAGSSAAKRSLIG